VGRRNRRGGFGGVHVGLSGEGEGLSGKACERGGRLIHRRLQGFSGGAPIDGGYGEESYRFKVEEKTDTQSM